MIGGSLNYFDHSLFNVSGNGITLDLGLTQKINRISLALVAKNALTLKKMTYSNDAIETFPVTLAASSKVAFRLVHLFSSFEYHKQDDLYFALYGIKFRLKDQFREFWISAGAKQVIIYDEVRSILNLGSSLKIFPLTLTVSIEQADYGGSQLQYFLSLSIAFGRKNGKRLFDRVNIFKSIL